MSKALDGINLVEFDSNLGAAYAAMLLAEQGARAIKVEPPGGSRERGTPHFHVLNRSKRALFLDVQARALARRAAAPMGRRRRCSDGPRRGCASLDSTMRRFAASIPHLVVLHVPPLGNRGPLADFDASDELASALGGIYGSQWALSGNPVALHFPGRQLFGGRARRRPRRSLRSARASASGAGRSSRSRFWPAPFRCRPAASCATKR